jgi:4-hydroxythreonine-4-phosphate dehydrogenase
LGDPRGIGAEVTLAALAAGAAGGAEVRLFGESALVARARRAVGLSESALAGRFALQEVASAPVDGRELTLQEAGRAQLAYLEAAVDAVLRGEADALVTAPISKAAVASAGFRYPGHTEYLAARAGRSDVVMMLAGPHLRVALATTHVPLAQVVGLLTVEGVARTLVVTAEALLHGMATLGRPPRVALAALNPHAGEDGLFGRQEAEVLTPALALAREQLEGRGSPAELTGPHVPDVVFRRAARGEYDAVVALYHDQGLIPLKLLDFDEAVNVSLGLPFVRTSPDHGVALDIAGTGRANPASMAAAIGLAVQMACARPSQLQGP